MLSMVYTPRASVRKGKSAYSSIHPQELVASCLDRSANGWIWIGDLNQLHGKPWVLSVIRKKLRSGLTVPEVWMMSTNELLTQVCEAHGGLDRWKTFKKVSATFVTGGGLLPLKGFDGNPKPLPSTVTVQPQTTVIFTFGNPDWRMNFRPERVVIEMSDGKLVEERSNPRTAFDGHTLNTPWDLLHRAYFNGYTRWTYLTTPYLLTMPGFEVEEIAPWEEGTERWRGLRARFPDYIASHSKEQDFYFGDNFLLRRHDYYLEVAGGVPVAQYVYDIDIASIRMEADTCRGYLSSLGMQCGFCSEWSQT